MLFVVRSLLRHHIVGIRPARLVRVCGLVVSGLWALTWPARAQAQVPAIEVSSQPYFYDCQLDNDSGPGLRTVYVRHDFNIGAVAARFKIALATGSDLTYVSETHPFAASVGNTQTGLSVCYGGCLAGGQMLASITYMYNGSSFACNKLLVLPHPSAQTVEVIGCTGVPVVADVGDLYVVMPGGICGCPTAHRFPGTPQVFDCTPVAVASTTWGAIKALYRD